MAAIIPPGACVSILVSSSMSILVATKVIGTATTGIWAGYNFATTTNVAEVPGLDLIFGTKKQPIPSKSVISSTIRKASKFSVLSGLISISLLTSYVLSSRRGKHPYLLYVALGAPLIGLLQYFGAEDLVAQLDSVSTDTAKPDTPEPIEETSDLTGSIYESIDHPKQKVQSLKAEATNMRVEDKSVVYTRSVALLSFGLFFVNLVGLAGDAF